MCKHRRSFNLFCGFIYTQEPVLIDWQLEANVISVKAETLPVPDETFFPHQATF